MDKMNALLTKRQALYGAVPNRIDTSDLTVDEVVEQLVALYGGLAG